MTRTRRHALIAAAALPLAALVLTGCGSVHGNAGGSSTGSSDSSLPLLHVGVRGANPEAAGMSGATDTSGYPLETTLPTGPATASLFRTSDGAATADAAAAIAGAFGVNSTPVRHAHGWAVTSPQGDVRLRDSGEFSAWRAGASCPYQLDVDSATTGASAVGCAWDPSIASCPRALSPTQGLAFARPLIDILSLDPTTARVGSDAQCVVDISVRTPDVAGLKVIGGGTSISVDATGLRTATGQLGAPVKGPAYPIISAAQALDLLRAMPRPAIACMQGASCPGVGPQHVTGVELGLVPADDAGSPVLLPAWLFTVKESPEPIAIMAVVDAYLADPTDTTGNAPAISASGAPGSVGASAVPDGPGASPVPVPTDSAPSAGTAPGYVPIERASVSADGRTLTLYGWGGNCTTYSGTAKEDAGHVYAVIEATPMKTVQVCDAMAKEIGVEVRLQSPLGSRVLIDATSNSERVIKVA